MGIFFVNLDVLIACLIFIIRLFEREHIMVIALVMPTKHIVCNERQPYIMNIRLL